MLAIKAQITKFVDMNVQPGLVECRFIDALGKEHIFIEKIPVVTSEHLTEGSDYPRNGYLACEIVEERIDNGSNIIKVTTEQPWSIESTEGELIFEVLSEQVVTFDNN